MVHIPPKPQQTQEQAFARLQVWYGMQQKLAEAKTAEVLERRNLALYYFPTPEEGTNRLPLGGGFDLKLGYSITRKVDEAALANVPAAAAKKLKLNLDDLFPTKPTLNLAAYRALTDEQRAYVDTLLDIKEGDTPSLAIVPQVDEKAVARHVPKAATPAPVEVPAYTIAQAAESAQPGHYYTDGDGSWWLLNDDMEWQEVDEETVASLEAQAAMVEDPPPAPEKKTRKRRAKKGEE